jgi:hypothetical protein
MEGRSRLELELHGRQWELTGEEGKGRRAGGAWLAVKEEEEGRHGGGAQEEGLRPAPS